MRNLFSRLTSVFRPTSSKTKSINCYVIMNKNITNIHGYMELTTNKREAKTLLLFDDEKIVRGTLILHLDEEIKATAPKFKID